MMTFEEIAYPKRYVRVIDSTFNPNGEKRLMIGEEWEVYREDYTDKEVDVWGKDGTYSIFNRSDCVDLTPVEFKGRKIGILDQILIDDVWYTVTGAFQFDEEWKIIGTTKEGNSTISYIANSGEIEAHRPLGIKNNDKEAWLKQGEEMGWVKDKKVIE